VKRSDLNEYHGRGRQPTRTEFLDKVCHEALVSGLSEAVKKVVRDAIAKGFTAAQIKTRALNLAGRQTLVTLGIDAYLDELVMKRSKEGGPHEEA
jgi:hypothetical protein